MARAFQLAFGEGVGGDGPCKRRRCRPRGPGGDKEQRHAEEDRARKLVATRLLANPLFVAMVENSYLCKEAVHVFLLWSQKAEKQYNQQCKKKHDEGGSYWGPTPLSLIVSEKGLVKFLPN